MRIQAGHLKGKQIDPARGFQVRPTTSRLRQRLFDVLTQGGAASCKLEGAIILDLFAGSGALAIEALSRGAAKAVFIDHDSRICRTIRQTLTRLQLIDQALILRRDACRLNNPPPLAPFDCVFIDPPYQHDVTPALLAHLLTPGWLAIDARIIVEIPLDLDHPYPGYQLLDQRQQGRSKLLFLRPDKTTNEPFSATAPTP